MKHLKRFNENIYDDIKSECEDILIPFVDDGIDINVEIYGFINVEIHIIIGDHSKSRFDLEKYIPELEHINSYLESVGYKYKNTGPGLGIGLYDDFQDFIRYSPTLSSHHIIKFIKVNKNTAIY